MLFIASIQPVLVVIFYIFTDILVIPSELPLRRRPSVLTLDSALRTTAGGLAGIAYNQIYRRRSASA